MMEASTRLVMARRIPIRIWLLRLGVLPPARLIRWVSGIHGRVTFQISSSSVPELRTTLEIGQKRCRSAFTFSRSERHFDFLKQLCAAAVESRLGVDGHEEHNRHRYARQRNERPEQDGKATKKLNEDRRPRKQGRRRHAKRMQEVRERLWAAGDLRVSVLHESIAHHETKRNRVPRCPNGRCQTDAASDQSVHAILSP